jgi:deoxyadenosine/deoxycytidine kinase
MTRVEKRGRESETSGGLSMDYLQRLHELHEETYAVDGSFPADLILDAESRSPQELAEELVDFYSLR